MKKYSLMLALGALMLGCGVANAEALTMQDVDYTLNANTTSVTFEGAAPSSAMTFGVVNLQAWKTILTQSWNRNIISVHSVSGANYVNYGIGQGTYSSNQSYRYYNYDAAGSTALYGNGWSLKFDTESDVYVAGADLLSDLNTLDVQSAVIGFAYTKNAGSHSIITLSYLTESGDLAFKDYGAFAAPGLKSSNFNVNGTSINSALLTTGYVFTGENVTTDLMADTAHTVAKAALVPEPATATLSLLALAGLAARRRRH